MPSCPRTCPATARPTTAAARTTKVSSMQVQLDAVARALRDAHGHGLTLKQLAGQLHLGQSARQPLRRALQQLLGQGHATYDGHRYRFKPQAAQTAAPAERRAHPREQPRKRSLPAALVE